MDNIQWDKLAPIMLDNSERWFPALHDTRHSALVHFTLGLAGEVGELVEAIYTSGAKWDADLIASSAELLAEESEIDLLAAIEAKVLVCEARWG